MGPPSLSRIPSKANRTLTPVSIDDDDLYAKKIVKAGKDGGENGSTSSETTSSSQRTKPDKDKKGSQAKEKEIPSTSFGKRLHEMGMANFARNCICGLQCGNRNEVDEDEGGNNDEVKGISERVFDGVEKAGATKQSTSLFHALQLLNKRTASDEKGANIDGNDQTAKLESEENQTVGEASLGETVSTLNTTGEKEPKARQYDANFTRRFLRRMTTKGFALLFLQSPEAESVGAESSWSGRTVTMTIIKGRVGSNTDRSFASLESDTSDCSAVHAKSQPRLEWTTIPGGTNMDVITTSIRLFDIATVTTSADAVKLEFDDVDMCVFSIITQTGKVHVFEANSMEDRDKLVEGLRNVISQLAFSLIAGGSESNNPSDLYQNEQDLYNQLRAAAGGALPSLPEPRHTINRLSHALLD